MSDNRSQENDRPFMVRETDAEKKDVEKKELSEASQKPKKAPKTDEWKKSGQSDTENKTAVKPAEKAPVVNKEPIEETLDDKEAYYEEKRQNRQIINSEIVADASDDLLDLIEKKKNRSEILYDRLMQNKDEGKVIYGEVAGVRIESERVLVDVLWNGIRIIVPHSAYFQSSWNMGNNFDELSKEEKLLKIQRNAREMLGSYCPVVVKAVVKNPVEEGSFKGEDKIIRKGRREVKCNLQRTVDRERGLPDIGEDRAVIMVAVCIRAGGKQISPAAVRRGRLKHFSRDVRDNEADQIIALLGIEQDRAKAVTKAFRRKQGGRRAHIRPARCAFRDFVLFDLGNRNARERCSQLTGQVFLLRRLPNGIRRFFRDLSFARNLFIQRLDLGVVQNYLFVYQTIFDLRQRLARFCQQLFVNIRSPVRFGRNVPPGVCRGKQTQAKAETEQYGDVLFQHPLHNHSPDIFTQYSFSGSDKKAAIES